MNDSREVALGDLDGDGDLDAFVVNGGTQDNQIYTNRINEGMGFSNAPAVMGLGDASLGVALGDLDGDGDLDAFVVNGGTQDNQIYTNRINEGMGFTNASTGPNPGNSSSSVALGDLDGDGDLDAFVVNSNNEANQIYTNNGSGGFTNAPATGANNSSLGVALGDLD